MLGVYSLRRTVALDDAEGVFDDTMTGRLMVKTFLSTFLTAMCVVASMCPRLMRIDDVPSVILILCYRKVPSLLCH